MKKITYVLLSLGFGLCTSQAQTTVNFTDGEGFTSDGADIGGQGGWASYGFGTGGADFDLNSTNDTLVYNFTGSGAVRRDFSAVEAGTAFVEDATIITWSFTIFDIDNTQPFGTGGTGLQLYLSDFGSGLSMQIRRDGLLQVNDGVRSGNDRISADLQNGETVSIALNYFTNTYTLTRSTIAGDVFSQESNAFTDTGFTDAVDPVVAYRLRLQGNSNVPGNSGGQLQLSSFSVSAASVPEPSSYALISGFLAFGWMMVRRRK